MALGIAVAGAHASNASGESSCRGSQFIGFTNFSDFEKLPADQLGQSILTSPEIATCIDWQELIVSWNAEMARDASLRIEARPLDPESATHYYALAAWSGNPKLHLRTGFPKQKDKTAEVATDILKLHRPCCRLQVRLTLTSKDPADIKLKFLGLSLLDTNAEPAMLPPNQSAWGETIPVPERSQMVYPNGKILCSPTTVSMLLAYWSRTLNRPELEHDVPEISKEIYDPHFDGTGNWPFNMAYAGSFKGMRAYVTRFSDVSELEDWIASGIPVGLSVCYNKLRGKKGAVSGHLVVCVGFTENGDPIINDPGTRQNVRKIFPRQNLISAWANSRNAVYLIYPEDAAVPQDRFGHWYSNALGQ
jgi:hypothetical protein